MTEKPATRSILLEPIQDPVRVEFGGEIVAQSDQALILREGDLKPVFYIPKEDVRWEFATPTDRASHCPYKGDAEYWSLTAGGKTAENAIWGYPDPIYSMQSIRNRVAFYWDKMDAWFLGDRLLTTQSY